MNKAFGYEKPPELGQWGTFDTRTGSISRTVLRTILRLALIIESVFLGVSVLLQDSSLSINQNIYFLTALIAISAFFNSYYRTTVRRSVANVIMAKTLAWTSTFLFITLLVTLSELRNIPRSFLLSVVFISYLVDLAVTLAKSETNNEASHANGFIDKEKHTPQYPISYLNTGIGFVVLLSSIVAAMTIKSAGLQLYVHYEQLFTIIIGSWVVSIGLTRAYRIEKCRNIYYQIAPVLKLGVTMALLAGFFYWYGQLEYVSRGVLYGSIAIFTGVQLLALLVRNVISTDAAQEVTLPRLVGERAQEAAGAPQESPSGRFELGAHLPRQILLQSRQEITEWLRRTLPAVKRNDVSILFSTEPQDLKGIREGQRVLIDLHVLNQVQGLNSCLRAMRHRLKKDGYLVVWAYPLETTYERLRSSMPKSVFVFVYPLHFLLFRVVPKLPIVGRVFFFVTKGRNPIISKVEILGRLVYNGFSIVDFTEIDHKLYVVARADRPMLDVEPSFGPLAKLSRVGYQGRRVTVYKFRTMYPYSEFLQEEIYKANCEIDERSKFVNDYRITAWGNILRKYWIDELPQLYNWWKGDIGLVGVRALSEHKFSLYPEDLQQLRVQFKPGLVPPLYADLPQTFEEIVGSEKAYLRRSARYPLRTEFNYFVKAMYNILIKGARSS